MSTQKWISDPAHSEVGFKVKHMMISTVTGTIQQFNVTVETDNDDFENSNVSFEADLNAIHTGNDQRDGHLKSPDFFDTATYPKLAFQSTKMTKKANGEYTLTGNLTIKDTTNEVTLNATFGGIGKDPWGNTKAGFTLEGKIQRSAFGLNWNAALEAGGVLVSDEVKIAAEVQLTPAP